MSDGLRFALTFAVATVVAAVVHVLRCRLSGETSFSAPFGVAFVVGLPAAVSSHVTGTPLAAVAVVALYAVAAWWDLRQDLRMQREAARRVSGAPAADPGRGSDDRGAG